MIQQSSESTNTGKKHIDPHELLISSMQWQPEIHYGMTMAHNILNICRARNAGDITFYTNSTFNVSKNDICLLGIRIGKRCC